MHVDASELRIRIIYLNCTVKLYNRGVNGVCVNKSTHQQFE